MTPSHQPDRRPSPDIDATIQDLKRRRHRKLIAVLAGFVGALGVLVAFTYATYTSSPGDVPADRIGEEAVEPLAPDTHEPARNPE